MHGEEALRNEIFALQDYMLLEDRNLVFGMFLDSTTYWMKKITFQINVLNRHLNSLLKIKLASGSVGLFLCGLIAQTYVLDLKLFKTCVLTYYL